MHTYIYIIHIYHYVSNLRFNMDFNANTSDTRCSVYVYLMCDLIYTQLQINYTRAVCIYMKVIYIYNIISNIFYISIKYFIPQLLNPS